MTPPPDSFCLISPLNVLLFPSVISRCYLHFSFSSFTDKVIYIFGVTIVSFLLAFLFFLLFVIIRILPTGLNLKIQLITYVSYNKVSCCLVTLITCDTKKTR